MTIDKKLVALDDLIAAYADAAAAHGRCTASGDVGAGNVHAEEIATIYRELRDRGPTAQRALLPLLQHPDDNVRSWVGAHALEFAPDVGEPVLDDLAASPGFAGLGAAVTLREWRRGALRFT